MAELDSRQIENITREAQAGNGCALQEQFVNLNLNEQLKALHDLRESYAKQSGSEVDAVKLSLTALQISSKSNSDALVLSVGYNKKAPLFQETINIDSGTAQYSCSDVTPQK